MLSPSSRAVLLSRQEYTYSCKVFRERLSDIEMDDVEDSPPTKFQTVSRTSLFHSCVDGGFSVVTPQSGHVCEIERFIEQKFTGVMDDFQWWRDNKGSYQLLSW